MRRSGFTIIELAIVLTIIGLIAGGVLTGRSLMRTAQIGKVLADASAYRTAMVAFNDQYGYLPGDFPTATSQWGDDNAACPDAAITDGSPGTCNGNGSGLLDPPTAINATGEIFQLWKQLALGGYIQGNYTGLNGPGHANRHVIPGANAPPGALEGSAYWAYSLGIQTGSSSYFAGNYNNALIFGRKTASVAATSGVLTPTQAYGIDTKADDGKPAFGGIRTWAKTYMAAAAGADSQNGKNCVSLDTAAAVYERNAGDPICTLIFTQDFKNPNAR